MKRIALIEDNPDNRLLARALLEDRFAVSEYVDGPSALASLPGDPPDLVLLDISLPGMDGTEVLRRLRGLEALTAIPVIAFTAHTELGDGTFRALGFDGFIGKPVEDMDSFSESIDRLLARDAAVG